MKPTPKPPSPLERKIRKNGLLGCSCPRGAYISETTFCEQHGVKTERALRGGKLPPSPRALIAAARKWRCEMEGTFLSMPSVRLTQAIDTYEKRLKTAKGGRRK